MPRLSTLDYLRFHVYLHEIWHTQQQAFSLVSTKDQRSLHDYFRSSEHLTEADLLAHRVAITQEGPSLPHCAGRALRHLADPLPLRQPSGSGRIVLYPLLKPNPDLARMSRALLAVVIREHEARRRRGAQAERCFLGQ